MNKKILANFALFLTGLIWGVSFVAQKIASSKGLSLEEVEKMTVKNTKRILKIRD